MGYSGRFKIALFFISCGLITGLRSAEPDGAVILRIASAQQARKLKPGSTVDGRLLRPVFAGAREVLPAGTRVQLTVRDAKKERTDSRGLLRRGVAIATGEPGPKPTYSVAVQSATVTLPDGKTIAGGAGRDGHSGFDGAGGGGC